MNPKKILMIKSHSMGVGDVLRSSAAWRVLKNRWPTAELHLIFLSKHAGYPTENLMQEHHLLNSATFITIRERSPEKRQAKRISIFNLARKIQEISRQIQPELIIDFEPSGLRTSLLTMLAGQACHAKTVGIGEFPGRNFFYNYSAPRVADYIKSNELNIPMDYTHRDFVVLTALGLKRQNTAIELNVTSEGQRYYEALQHRLPQNRPVMGLNIGCGTPDAMIRRPNLYDIAQVIGLLAQKYPHTILLTGADFEKSINEEFIIAYKQLWGNTLHIINHAGETSLSGLTGLIKACNIFISTDSGPYHMSVAQRKPTIAWFTYEETTAFHDHPWCRRLIQPNADQFLTAFKELMA